MKLDAESSLPLDALKGAYVYKYIKVDGVEKEVSYRIYNFSIEFDGLFENPKNKWEWTGYELSDVSVQLIPFEDEKWNTDKLVGMQLKDLKDYTIQLSSGHPKEWE
tara:strand:+ start:271 stop:588 length:318 start_codon:yes stop_codon:yes gene_type:complete